jgi:predicted MFS family arabinose efflux permease
MAEVADKLQATERKIIQVVAAAQFINVLEFVIVMPLGPDFAKSLGVPMSQLSYVASAYTATAAVVGVLGAFVLDRFDRRKALLFSLLGLILSTASAGFAQHFSHLIVSRACAGFFGGPATSLSMSIVADAVPEQRRGRAFSIVLLAFSMASIFGVPAGLELARVASWRAPFFAIAALGLVAVFLTAQLPPLVAHMQRASTEPSGRALLRILENPTVLRSYLMTFVLQMSGFLIIPSISPYLQANVHFPRAKLGTLYLLGGVMSLMSTRASGRLVDRYGSLRVGTTGLCAVAIVIVLGYAHVPPVWAVVLLFPTYLVAQSLRNVAYNTLASKVPASDERARFQSLQSSVTHIAISIGAAVAGRILTTAPDGALIGMPTLSYLAIGVSALVPVFMWQVERRVSARGKVS